MKYVNGQIDLWKEGKWIDMWSLNHVLAGVLILPTMNWLGFTQYMILIISTAIFIGWEVFERIYHLEHFTNQFMDMVTNYIGFGISWYLYFILQSPLGPFLFWVLGITFLALEYLGYRAYKKRTLDINY